MTYFNLRKRTPEPETEDVEEDVNEAWDEAEEDTRDTPEKAAPTSWREALWCGIRGPSTWLTLHTNREVSLIFHLFVGWAMSAGVWVAAGIVALWLFGVLAFIPRDYKDRATAAVESLFAPAPKPPAVPAPGGEREAVRRLLLNVIGDAHGVHLKTVLAHLQEHGQWEGRKVADLRVHLEALGIPVDPKLKVAGVPTRGVLRTALEALPPLEETSPSPTPSPPV
jgi:hypothetical protein